MKNMFSLCSSLIELNLSNFEIGERTNVTQIFQGCKSLYDIILTNFKSNNTNVNHMLKGFPVFFQNKIKYRIKNLGKNKDLNF